MSDQTISRAAALAAAKATQGEIVDLMNDPAMRPRLTRENGTMGVQRCVHILDDLTKTIEAMPGTATPEPSPLSSTARLGFILEDETWYAHTTLIRRKPRVHAELSLDVRALDDDAAEPTGEWVLTWTEIGYTGQITIGLSVPSESWDAFTMCGFDEILDAIQHSRIDDVCPTPHEVAEILTRYGWTDTTPREMPETVGLLQQVPNTAEALLEAQQALCEMLAFVLIEAPASDGTIAELTRVIRRTEAVTGHSFEPRKGVWA